ncbi:MAG TPA: preprotein translocase subunit YajC [Deltaproteobacteria bacterium]|nr:preprotein translocase subunit YajC [Deltaproteobacteria bacterium]
MNPVDLLPILLIFGVMYFLIVRPQIKERQEHDKLLESLTRDDAVVTSAGIHGKVVSVSDATVVLDIGDKTRITIDKNSVARRQGEPAKAT